MTDDPIELSSSVTPSAGPNGFVDGLWAHLDAAFRPGAWRRLAEFVQRQATSKWIIATDFCIRDAARPNDSFAFVLLPAGDRRGQTNALLGELPNKDLKRARTIDPAMKRALRDGRAFTICFVADRERRLYRDAQAARSSLDQMIENAQRWKNAADCAKIIDELRAMRAEASKASVSLRLLEDLTVTAAVAAYFCANSGPSNGSDGRPIGIRSSTAIPELPQLSSQSMSPRFAEGRGCASLCSTSLLKVARIHGVTQ
jgi:hypothetical protein